MSKKVQNRIQYLKKKKQTIYETTKYRLHDLWYVNEGAQSKDKMLLSKVDTNMMGYSRTPAIEQRISLGDFVVYEQGFLATLSASEIKLITKRIDPNIKRSNLFIALPLSSLKASERRAFNKLIDKQVLYDLGHKVVFCINPTKLRHGSTINCIAASIARFKKIGEVSKKLYVHLTPPDKVDIDLFDGYF